VDNTTIFKATSLLHTRQISVYNVWSLEGCKMFYYYYFFVQLRRH